MTGTQNARFVPVGLVSVVLASALGLTGCGSDDDSAVVLPTPTTSTSTTAPPQVPPATTRGTPSGTGPAASYCESLLTRTDVSALAGVPMGAVSIQSVGSTPGCLWRARAKASRVTVSVVNASSSTWAAQLPSIAQGVRATGATLPAELRAQLRQAAGYLSRKQEVDADLACEIFSGLATATGSDPGVDATLRLTPSTQAPVAVSTQVCNSDEYSFLQLDDPALASLDAAGLADRVAAMRAALQQVQGAPLTY